MFIMNRFIILAIACLLVIIPLAASKPVEPERTNKQLASILPRDQLNKRQLDFVGTVDGKSFYADTSAVFDWESAERICWLSGLNLKLGKVTSQAQHNFLRDNLRQGYYYWTSGRDALDERQVVWGDTNGAVTRFEGEPGIVGIRTAVSFHPAGGHLDLEALNIGNYVLCENI